MSAVVKLVLILLCVGALGFVVLKFILPLVALYAAGVGVKIPLPTSFVRTHPQ